MQRSLVAELSEKIGEKVLLKGWMHNLRTMGKLNFMVLRDRSGLVQVVIEDKETLGLVRHLQPGTVLEVSGEVAATDKTDLGVEILSPSLSVINAVKSTWPVEINKPELNANLDTILENRSLTLRHPRQAAIFKIQGVMAQSYREYMIKAGFTEFFGPAMIASSSEGGAEIFKFNYFGSEATLAQSNQLYKQVMVGVYERVFGMAKWFRAENSNTRRHLTEGIQYEFEMGFIEGIDEVMLELEGVLRYMLSQVVDKCSAELKLLGVELVKVPETEFPKLTFAEAVKVVSEKTGEDTSTWDDLTTESERVLCAYAREQYGSDFIFVTNYPKGKFYAYRDEQGVFHNFDLLCREAEIVSGGRRVDNYDELVSRIKAEGMEPDTFSEYLSIFEYGMPPHGGFGLGFERFTMMALGLENIREATLFPSDTKRVASQSLPEKKVVGAENIKKAIKQLFVDAGLEFSVLKHEPTPTSEDSAKARGLNINAGVKALILRDKKTGRNVMVNVPAGAKLDIKKFQAVYSEKYPAAKLEFEKPETIKEKYGLVVGGVPPFGEVFGIETFNDQAIFTSETVAFNNSDQSESLITSAKDLAKVLGGMTGEYIVVE